MKVLNVYKMLQNALTEGLSVWNKWKFWVAQWTTNGWKLGSPVNTEWSIKVMCCAHFRMCICVDVIISFDWKVLGLPTDHLDGFLGRPVDLFLASGDSLFYTLARV